MLKKELKRSSRYNEDGALPELVGRDLERNIDNVDTKMEADDEETLEVSDDAEEVDAEEVDVELEENPEEEVPDHLETDLEEPEEEFKDINEKVVVYLYRGFAELGDNVRVFVDDVENEERDPELVETLTDFMEGYPEVMDVIKSLADKYVTSVELFDPEEGEEVGAEEEPVEDEEIEDEDEVEELDIEDKETVESFLRETNYDSQCFESEYEIYAPYSSSKEADEIEARLRGFKGSEVFRHEDIGEIHAFIRVSV